MRTMETIQKEAADEQIRNLTYLKLGALAFLPPMMVGVYGTLFLTAIGVPVWIPFLQGFSVLLFFVCFSCAMLFIGLPD